MLLTRRLRNTLLGTRQAICVGLVPIDWDERFRFSSGPGVMLLCVCNLRSMIYGEYVNQIQQGYDCLRDMPQRNQFQIRRRFILFLGGNNSCPW